MNSSQLSSNWHLIFVWKLPQQQERLRLITNIINENRKEREPFPKMIDDGYCFLRYFCYDFER